MKANNIRAWLLAVSIAASYAIIGECEAMKGSVWPDSSQAKNFQGKMVLDEDRAKRGVSESEKTKALAIVDLMQENIRQPAKKIHRADSLRTEFCSTMKSVLKTKIGTDESVNKNTNDKIASLIVDIRRDASYSALSDSGEEFSKVISNFLGYENDITLRWYIYLFLRCAIDSSIYDEFLTYTECMHRAQYLVFRICEVWFALYDARTSASIQRDIQEGNIVALTPREIKGDIATLKIMEKNARKATSLIQNGDLVPVFVSEMLQTITQTDAAQAYITSITELKRLKDAAAFRGLDIPNGLALVIARALGLSDTKSHDFRQKILNILSIDRTNIGPRRAMLEYQKLVHAICDIWRSSDINLPAAVSESQNDEAIRAIRLVKSNCEGETADAFLTFFESILNDESGRNIAGFGKLLSGLSLNDRETIVSALQNLVLVSGRLSLDKFRDTSLESIRQVCAVFNKNSQAKSQPTWQASLPLSSGRKEGDKTTASEKNKHRHYLKPDERRPKTQQSSLNDNDDDDKQANNTRMPQVRPAPDMLQQSGEQISSSKSKKKVSIARVRPKISKTTDTNK